MALVLALFESFVPLVFKYDFKHILAAAGSNQAQSGSTIIDHFLAKLGRISAKPRLILASKLLTVPGLSA